MCRRWHRTWILLPVLLFLVPVGLQAHEPDLYTSDYCPDAIAPPAAAAPLADRNNLLVEGFESDVPPPGWAIIHLGNTYTWADTVSEHHSGARSAYVRYGGVNSPQDEYLVTPALDFSNLTSAFVEFYEAMNYWTGYGDHHYIAVSTTSQTDFAAFTTVVDWTPANHNIPPHFGITPVTVDLSAYLGQPVVYVAFRYTGTYADNWYIDDVRIMEPFAHDIAVEAVLPDGLQFTAPFNLTPRVVVENKGENPETFDLSLTTEESGVQIYSEIVSVSLNVTERDTIDFPAIPLNPGNYYHLHGENLLPGDLSPDNNRANSFIDTYTQTHVPLGFLHTNSGSGPSAGADNFLDNYIAGQGNNVALIRVHTWWPNRFDVMYLADSLQCQALIYYDEDGSQMNVPNFWADGSIDFSDDVLLYTGALEARKNVHSPASLSMTWLEESEELVVRVDVLEPMDPEGDYRLRVAITEDNVPHDGGNNHLLHQQAFRHMFPDVAGLSVPAAIGQYTYVVPCPLDLLETGHWNTDFNNLRATAYLQEESSRRVWQAGTGFLKDFLGSLKLEPHAIQVYEGESFDLQLNIEPTGLGIKGVEAKIDFDESSMRLDSITPGPWFTESGQDFFFFDYTPNPPSQASIARFASAFLADASSAFDGTVAVCHFTAIHFGISTLSFIEAKVRDLDNHELDFHTSSGDVVYVLPVNTGTGEEGAPQALRLVGNVPNPFNPRTTIKYELPSAGDWRVEVYDASGRQVRTLASGPQEPGRYELVWDGRDDGGSELGSGLYFARVSGPAGASTGKMLLLK